MRLHRIRLLKARRDRLASSLSSTGAGSVAMQVAESPLPRRQPKFPQVKADRTPVDLAILRKVLDALNEQLPLIVTVGSAELPRTALRRISRPDRGRAPLADPELRSPAPAAQIWHCRTMRPARPGSSARSWNFTPRWKKTLLSAGFSSAKRQYSAIMGQGPCVCRGSTGSSRPATRRWRQRRAARPGSSRRVLGGRAPGRDRRSGSARRAPHPLPPVVLSQRSANSEASPG